MDGSLANVYPSPIGLPADERGLIVVWSEVWSVHEAISTS